MLNRNHRLRAFFRDTSGSDSIEMVYTSAMIVCFILVALSFFTYIFELNLCNTATRQVVREIEVSGEADSATMQSIFERYMGTNSSISEPQVSIDAVSFVSGRKIQLKDTFRVTGSCVYRLTLLNPGKYTGFTIDIPLKSTVSGMSEVYWTSSSGYTEKS